MKGLPRRITVLFIWLNILAFTGSLAIWLLTDSNASAFNLLFNGAMVTMLYCQLHPKSQSVDHRLFNT